jgi:hypothetical protein
MRYFSQRWARSVCGRVGARPGGRAYRGGGGGFMSSVVRRRPRTMMIPVTTARHDHDRDDNVDVTVVAAVGGFYRGVAIGDACIRERVGQDRIRGSYLTAQNDDTVF